MGADRISPKAFTQEEKTDRRARGPPPTQPLARLETARPEPPNWAKRPEIRFLHENSKTIPAGSNPSKRHCADEWMIVPVRPRAFQGPFNPRVRSQPSIVGCENQRRE
jgi:hypothetical protein